MQRAAFLDRDGVLNALVERDGKHLSPLQPMDFVLLPGAAKAVATLRCAGLLAIVVTNQPEIRRGRLSAADLSRMHVRLEMETMVSAIYVCPHDDCDNCVCRKPRPGMLQAAARDRGIDLAASFVVGDSWKDIEAGHAVGCATILLRDLKCEQVESSAEAVRATPEACVASLSDAVEWILEKLAGVPPEFAPGNVLSRP